MSFKVTKLTVAKSKTRGNEKEGWTKTFYQMEAEIEDEHTIEICKASLEGLIDGWLTPPSEGTSQPRQPQPQSETLNPDAIKWQLQPGLNNPKGAFEKSEDFNNSNHKGLVKKLAANKGFLRHKGFQYWLYANGSSIGRRALKKTGSGGS